MQGLSQWGWELQNKSAADRWQNLEKIAKGTRGYIGEFIHAIQFDLAHAALLHLKSRVFCLTASKYVALQTVFSAQNGFLRSFPGETNECTCLFRKSLDCLSCKNVVCIKQSQADLKGRIDLSDPSSIPDLSVYASVSEPGMSTFSPCQVLRADEACLLI